VTDQDAPAPLSERHLVDSTVWSNVRTKTRPDLAVWFNMAVQADLVATCEPVVLELLRSARDSAAFARQADLLALLPTVPTGERQFLRAREVQAALASSGRHRGVPPIDLLIAASAETAGLPVLHYDHDYDLIASVSRQRCAWLLPPGALP
jgi:predicted nucleic acid-binding protein